MKNYFQNSFIKKQDLLHLIALDGNLEQYLNQFLFKNHRFNYITIKDCFVGLIHSLITTNHDHKISGDIFSQLNFNLQKITPQKILFYSNDSLLSIGLTKNEIKIIKQLARDIIDRKIKLKKLKTTSYENYVTCLQNYDLSLLTIKTFGIFCLKRKDIFLKEETDFVSGIKKVYKNQKIDSKFLDQLFQHFKSSLTLFSLVMCQVNNLY